MPWTRTENDSAAEDLVDEIAGRGSLDRRHVRGLLIMFDLDARWRLHPQVALRPEPFGALLYHFGTRKLSFLKNLTVVDVVRALPASTPPRGTALRAAGVERRRDAYAKALGTLADSHDAGACIVTAVMPGRLIDQFELGLDAPICLTWELTYACNLSCVHCLSSSGRRDPRELTTEQCKDVIDELERMQVFYVNIGGGEPTVRSDFWELVDYATAHHVGVKFSTNGVRITPAVADQAGRQ